eukprot:1180278-Prorocentrum_minimum.AAC.1
MSDIFLPSAPLIIAPLTPRLNAHLRLQTLSVLCYVHQASPDKTTPKAFVSAPKEHEPPSSRRPSLVTRPTSASATRPSSGRPCSARSSSHMPSSAGPSSATRLSTSMPASSLPPSPSRPPSASARLSSARPASARPASASPQVAYLRTLNDAISMSGRKISEAERRESRLRNEGREVEQVPIASAP